MTSLISTEELPVYIVTHDWGFKIIEDKKCQSAIGTVTKMTKTTPNKIVKYIKKQFPIFEADQHCVQSTSEEAD